MFCYNQTLFHTILKSVTKSLKNTYLIAPIWRRIMALIYDILILVALMLIASAITVAVVGALFSRQALEAGLLDGNIWFRLFLLTVWFGYYALSWVYGGQTLGMKPWRLYTVKLNGKNMKWLDCLFRFSSSLFGFGLILALFHPQKRSLQDLFSSTKTLVLKDHN